MAGLQIIIFNVCGVTCALRREDIRELLPLPHLWQPPALPRPVAGFFNLGGQAVPAIRLNVLFGLPEEQGSAETSLYRHLILVQPPQQESPVALLVDRVIDVATIGSHQLSPLPEGDSLNGCIEAEMTLDGGLVHLLSLNRLFMAQERQALSELGRQAQSRLDEWAVQA